MDTIQPKSSLFLTNLRVTHLLSVNELVVNELETSEWDSSITTFVPELEELAQIIEEEIIALETIVAIQTTDIHDLEVETENLVQRADAAHASIVSLAAQVTALNLEVVDLSNDVATITAAIPDVGFHSVVTRYPYDGLTDWSGTVAPTNDIQFIIASLTGVGQIMEFDFGVQAAATYRIEYGVYQAGNAGIFDVSVSGTTYETDVDMYASSNVAANVPHRFVFEHAGGSMVLRWTCVDKNPSSSSFTCPIGYLWLDKFGA
jgi:hypothetical protein